MGFLGKFFEIGECRLWLRALTLLSRTVSLLFLSLFWTISGGVGVAQEAVGPEVGSKVQKLSNALLGGRHICWSCHG